MGIKKWILTSVIFSTSIFSVMSFAAAIVSALQAADQVKIQMTQQLTSSNPVAESCASYLAPTSQTQPIDTYNFAGCMNAQCKTLWNSTSSAIHCAGGNRATYYYDYQNQRNVCLIDAYSCTINHSAPMNVMFLLNPANKAVTQLS